jgi:hypothetical protein
MQTNGIVRGDLVTDASGARYLSHGAVLTRSSHPRPAALSRSVAALG